MRYVMCFAAAAVLSSPALAATAIVPALHQAKPEEAGKRICRTEGVTGSRLGSRKRCMTAQEWAELARLDRQSLERTQNMRMKGNDGGSALAVPFGRLN